MEAQSQPSIASFAEITRRVIARDGFEDYLPTVLYPARRQVLVLEGLPSDSDVEAVSLAWAQSNAVGNEQFFLAFKVSLTEFKIIRRNGPSLESQVFTA
jgi:hypothetical protein